MDLESKSVAVGVGVLLIEHTLLLDPRFRLLLLHIDPLLVRNGLFHVHSVGPVCLTFENQDLQISIVLAGLSK